MRIVRCGVSGIVQHVAAGQRVIVVLATDGGAAHVPHVDKHLGRDATAEEITAHRDFEFGWTVQNLGAQWVIPPVRGRDGALDDTAADRVLAWVKAQYGADVRIKTHSMYDTHPDHASLGRALQRMWDADRSTDARFYLAPHKPG
ncbi:PIG-L family deacetylase [Ornithinimicrobium sp. LYQ92]|uniref:PIG-L family deacetylase n=1 Tax=Serinicoccus sp. LYQ92 TaxID=3378798 RepID=UPI003851FC70